MFVEEDPIKSTISRKKVCNNVRRSANAVSRPLISASSSRNSVLGFPVDEKEDSKMKSSKSKLQGKQLSSDISSFESSDYQQLSFGVSALSSTSNSACLLQTEETSIPVKNYKYKLTYNKNYIPEFLSDADSPFSSYLRSGVKFSGFQKYKNLNFKVDVQFQYSDLNNDMTHGYLTIKDLTQENSTITTYFESEIIGEKHDFLSRINTDLLFINDKLDLYNWSKFSSFQNDLYEKVLRHVKNPRKFSQYKHKDCLNQRFVYMRWKEKYLVPDPSVQLKNASFNGIYYVRLDQLNGNILGFYYYNKHYADVKDIDDFGIRKLESGKPPSDQILTLLFVPDFGISQSFQFI